VRKLSKPMAEALIYTAAAGSMPYGTAGNTVLACLRRGYLATRGTTDYHSVWLSSSGVQVTAAGWAALIRTVPNEMTEIVLTVQGRATRERIRG
jgi:hypothetical protein